MKKALLVTVAIALAGGALAACETATPYQPLSSKNAQSGGYSETRLEADRWRVTFQGNSLTSRGTVENYLLYHAADLTLQQGFDWFEMADRSTDKQSDTYALPGPYGYGWRPYWRFYGGPYGWRAWDPYWGGPWGPGFGPGWGGPWGPDFQTVERYEASAEIVMGHGVKPASDRRALDAHEVTTNLASRIVRPK
jgi:hypothetical protein